MRFGIPTLILMAGPAFSVSAQTPTPPPVDTPKVEIKDVVKPGAKGFVTIQINFSNVGVLNARAKDIIETLYPGVPIVGIEHLPRDRRFEVSKMNFARNNEEILAKLGETLGLSITFTETTTDFLIVRNLTHPVPASWTPGHGTAPALNSRPPMIGMTGIGEVDKFDHLFNAYDIGMIGFINFLTDYTDKPVWNQTALTGPYSFSFKFAHKNVMKLLSDMGFDVFSARRTTQCVVIAPKPDGK